MIEMLENEVKKIENEEYRTIIICVGFGCLALTAISEKIADKIIENKLKDQKQK